MNKIYNFLLLGLTHMALAQGSWQPIWADEFDYTGLPQAERWSYDEGCSIANNELQYYAKERLKNTRVEDGALTIEAHKETMGGCAYTSGRLKSQYKGDWQYGKFEVRAKVPTFRGTWPAIWFLPTDSEYGTWPRSGEMDLMESVGYEPNTAYFTIHTEAYNHQLGTQRGANTTVQNFSADYHTYVLEWSPDSLVMSLDGNRHFSYKRVDNDYKKWPFNKPFFILLNFAVGGDWGGTQGVDDTKFPAKFLVDYVRVYKWVPTAGPYTLEVAASHGTVSRSVTKDMYDANEQVILTAVPEQGYEFKGWQSDFQTSGNPLTVTVNRDLNIKAVFAKVGDLVKNGDFDMKGRYWNFNAYGTAKATATVADNAAHITVTTANAQEYWQVQWIQTDIPLLKGHTYQFSFDAVASNTMPIVGNVGLNQDPWTLYTSQTVNAGTTKATFSKTFTMAVDDPKGRISFDLAKATGTVSLSNVSIVDLTVSDVDDAEFDALFTIGYEALDKKVRLASTLGLSSIQVLSTSGVLLYEQQAPTLQNVSFSVSEAPFILKAVDRNGRVYVRKLKYESE